MTTQKQRVLNALFFAGDDGICLHQLEPQDRYTCRNRISELRKQGHAIKTETCKVHPHNHQVARYKLEIK